MGASLSSESESESESLSESESEPLLLEEDSLELDEPLLLPSSLLSSSLVATSSSSSLSEPAVQNRDACGMVMHCNEDLRAAPSGSC